jgi:Recombinase
MADARTPMQKQREERRAQGWREANIWLTPEGQQRIARFLEPGESLSALIDRALAAFEAVRSGAVVKQETREITSEVTREEDLPAIITREVTRYLTSEAFRERLFLPLLKETLSSYLPSDLHRERTRELSGEVARDVTREPASVHKAALLRRIQALKSQRLSLQAIADRLNAEGVPTLSGKGRWQKGTIANLLAGK